jgi:hypothetical protein
MELSKGGNIMAKHVPQATSGPGYQICITFGRILGVPCIRAPKKTCTRPKSRNSSSTIPPGQSFFQEITPQIAVLLPEVNNTIRSGGFKGAFKSTSRNFFFLHCRFRPSQSFLLPSRSQHEVASQIPKLGYQPSLD